MSGRWPAIVDSVNRERREVRVEIKGVTDGAQELPIAEIEYAIGDSSANTEIRIKKGDLVWVDFIGGDPRYPIITGYRAKHTDNEVGTRRWQHDKIELAADESLTIIVGNTTVLCESGSVTVTTSDMTIDAANTTITGELRVDGGVSVGADVMTDAGISHNNHPHTGNVGVSTSPPLP